MPLIAQKWKGHGHYSPHGSLTVQLPVVIHASLITMDLHLAAYESLRNAKIPELRPIYSDLIGLELDLDVPQVILIGSQTLRSP